MQKRFRHSYLFPVALLLGLLLVSVNRPAVGQGTGTGTPSPETPSPMGFGPTAVQPDRVSNTVDTQLVVTGAGFEEGAAVVVDGYGALETTFVSASMLRALLPAGAPAGVYDVRVVNPDAATAVLPDALTIRTPDPMPGPTDTPEPTNTPQPTAFVRPVIVVQSYGASSAQITPGANLDFEMTLANAGQAVASNVIATFVAGDFTPRATGGVRAIGNLAQGQSSRFWQPLAAGSGLSGGDIATLEVRVTYTDLAGTAYEETFALTFPVVRAAAGVAPTETPTPTATATATPKPRLRPQLLVSAYEASVDPLTPGSRFTLSMGILNQGNADARRVTLIVGGGVEGSAPPPEGTPQPGGGVSGAGGEFGNFAPVGSSNVKFLGDLEQDESLQANVDLIVNASTDPGAYPVVVSFVYNDAEGSSFVDEQVVTLLVFKSPQVEINFYMEPPPFFVGQPGPLPLQLVNVGSSSTIFGNMGVTAPGAQLTNNNIFVGALEPGGFFPLDANLTAEQAGPLELTVRVSYTDDFNQPQVITRTLSVEVMEMEAPPFEEEPPIDPGMGGPGEPIDPGMGNGGGNETWRQKAWRFILGLIGLSSGPRTDTNGGMPPGGFPPPDVGPDVGPGSGPINVPVQ